jgi:hypothetical protein
MNTSRLSIPGSRKHCLLSRGLPLREKQRCLSSEMARIARTIEAQP